MSLLRVTVVLNRRQLDEGEEPGYLTEWAHEADYSTDEDGCRLDWGGGVESYFPWTSVLRVDWAPCDCFTCRREARVSRRLPPKAERCAPGLESRQLPLRRRRVFRQLRGRPEVCKRTASSHGRCRRSTRAIRRP